MKASRCYEIMAKDHWCEGCLGEVGLSGNSMYCWQVKPPATFTCNKCKKEFEGIV